MEPRNEKNELKGFTQTGSDSAAREILKPQRDPAFVKKAALLVTVVVLALMVLGYLVFLRSGKSLMGGNASERRFEPPPTPEVR